MLRYSSPDRACRPTGNAIQIVEGDRWVPEWPGDDATQDAWLYRWNGERVFSCDWGHFIAELDDLGWRQWWSDHGIAQLEVNENDGLFADSYSIPSYFTREEKIAILQTYPDPADVEQRLFALGTYLLVKGRHTFLNLDVDGAGVVSGV